MGWAPGRSLVRINCALPRMMVMVMMMLMMMVIDHVARGTEWSRIVWD